MRSVPRLDLHHRARRIELVGHLHARALQGHHPALRDARAVEERGAVGGLGARRVVHRDERRRHRAGGGLFPRRSAIRARTDRRVLSAQSSRRRLSPRPRIAGTTPPTWDRPTQMWLERARARVAPASSADSEVPKPERPPSCRSAPGIDRARRPGRPSRSASLCHARQPSLRKARSGFSRGDARSAHGTPRRGSRPCGSRIESQIIPGRVLPDQPGFRGKFSRLKFSRLQEH